MSATIKLSAEETRQFWEIPVLFEDDSVIALDKPTDLLCSPDPANPQSPSLLGLLHAGIAAGKPWAVERRLTYLMHVHRLDTETSGVLLLARSKPVFVQLTNAFGSEQPTRQYTVLAHGAPLEPRFVVDLKLAPHPLKPGQVRIDSSRGKRSRTTIEVREQFSSWVLLTCELATDRPHQLRVHLRHSRLPVVGDTLYGGRPLLLSRLKPGYRLKSGKTERPLIARPALHAEKLIVPHPITGSALTIVAPWPKDLTVAVKYLRRYAGANAGHPEESTPPETTSDFAASADSDSE